MNLSVLPYMSQGAATFAGAVFVLVGIWYKDRLETTRQSRNARVQIFAELRALVDMIELNNYLPIMKEKVEQIRAGQRTHIWFPTTRSFSNVYDANLHNLGLLGPLAGDVVRFYMMLNSAVEDKDTIAGIFRQIQELEQERRQVPDELMNRLLRFHEMLYAKFSSAVQIGERVLREADSLDAKPRKLRRGNRTAASAELDNVEKALDERLGGVADAQPAGAHQPVQQ